MIRARIALPLTRSAILAVLAAMSPPAAGAPVDASVWTGLGSVQHLEARFVQTQERVILKAPLQSEGQVTFRRPSSLTWVVESPARSTFTLEGHVARLEIPDVGLTETYDLAAIPEASRFLSSLLVWFRADAAVVERDFTVAYEQSPPAVRLVPRDPALAAVVREVTLQLAPDPWRVRGVRFLEPDGDRVEIVFRGVVLDGKPIPDP